MSTTPANVIELNTALAKAGVASRAFCIGEPVCDEAYCLLETPAVWEVFYSERGIKRSLRTFTTQNEACAYIFEVICKDPTARH